jgi:NADPH:quinone reductase-like Zn-dependent oxidoreductase
LGAVKVIDYTKEDFTRSGVTYNVIFDTVGKSSFSRCKGSLTQKGVYLTTVPTLAIYPQMLWTSKIGSKKAMIAFTGLRPSSEKTKDLIFLKELIEAGSWVPSAGNSQPWEFIVVKKQELKDQIVQIIAEQNVFSAKMELTREPEQRFQGQIFRPPEQLYYRGVPVFIIVCGDPRIRLGS